MYSTYKFTAIFNTKAVALNVFRHILPLVPKDIPVVYLSTHLCPAHIDEKIDPLRQRLQHGQPVICISTQLMETGMDLSFGCVVRSLAGIDSLIQAAGRCNRSGEQQGALGQVYLVHCHEEKLGSLRQIQRAQAASLELYDAFRAHPARFNNNVISPQAIDFFYQRYYQKQSLLLNYPFRCPGERQDRFLTDILGFNAPARQEYQKVLGTTLPSYRLQQSFETAGRVFRVIDNETTGVLIPYGEEGHRLAAALETSRAADLPPLLRQAQRFTVNLYENKLKELQQDGAVRFLESSGVWLLDERWYDDTTGLKSGSDPDAYIL